LSGFVPVRKRREHDLKEVDVDIPRDAPVVAALSYLEALSTDKKESYESVARSWRASRPAMAGDACAVCDMKSADRRSRPEHAPDVVSAATVVMSTG
jgi:hypothetical protein